MRLYCLFKFIWIHLDVKIYEVNNIRHSQHPMIIGKNIIYNSRFCHLDDHHACKELAHFSALFYSWTMTLILRSRRPTIFTNKSILL